MKARALILQSEVSQLNDAATSCRVQSVTLSLTWVSVRGIRVAFLGSARALRPGITDAALIDEAHEALIARHRCAQVDASYAAYDRRPIDEPDEWATWRRFG